MRRRSVVVWVLLFFALYVFFTNSLFSMKMLDNTCMQPGLNPGERFVFFSFNLQKILPDVDQLPDLPLHRGNIVLLKNYENQKTNIFFSIAGKLFRFFTIGKVGFPGDTGQLFIKRVIALPGDTISIKNFVARVQPAHDPYTYTEYELADKTYIINIPLVSTLVDSSVPFSGDMEEVVLGDDQCFLMSDDRSNTNDSRTWGPVDTDRIIGKAIFRYWPVNKLGLP
ncbi:MAG: signal peptidase I [Spirochaetaceae bacterium]|nr:signal peptidase I [Spirochaetaceae bacterium]